MSGRKDTERKVLSKLDNELYYLPDYLTDFKNSMHRLSYSTQDRYVKYVLHFLRFLESEYGIDIYDVNCFNKIRPSIIDSYLINISYKDKERTVLNSNNIISAKFYGIKKFFDFLLKDKYIDFNPCNDTEAPKDRIERDVVYMNECEIEEFLNNVIEGIGTDYAKIRQEKWRTRDYAIMLLGLSLGLRVSCMCEIDVDDIDFDNNTIIITEKGNKTRKVVFSNKLKDKLERWIEDRNKMLEEKNMESDALFISCQMGRMSRQSINTLVNKYSKTLNKHITPHKLRSSCATNIYDKTNDIYLVASVLGHKNLANTRKYTNVSDKRKMEAAVAMDSILF